jgi:hypothetical protein
MELHVEPQPNISSSLTSPLDDALVKRKRKPKTVPFHLPSDETFPEHDAPVAREIRERLEAALKPTLLTLVDDSASHSGHPGAAGYGSESHFKVIVDNIYQPQCTA